MAKKNETTTYIPVEKMAEVQKAYGERLNNDPKYSLDVDPLNEYHFSERERKFIRLYVQFKNIDYAASLSGFDEEEINSFFIEPSVQQEVRRLNTAIYHRQFQTKLLNIDEIGGYLTNVITDNCLPNDRVEGKDKLKAAQLLMQINKDKQALFSEPTYIDTVPLDEQLKDLSLSSIKTLIDNSYGPNDKKDKEDLISQLLKLHPELSAEDITGLKSLSIKELQDLINGENNA